MLLINRLMRRRKEGGAALVEFAVLAPFLILLVLGIVEFGYKFGQYNEIRHAAREGARYAAVSNPDLSASTWNANVVKAACSALQLPGATQKQVSMALLGSNPANTTTTAYTSTTGTNTYVPKDNYAKITVTATVPSLSGAPLIGVFVPSQLSNSVTFRLEQNSKWTQFPLTNCP